VEEVGAGGIGATMWMGTLPLSVSKSTHLIPGLIACISASMRSTSAPTELMMERVYAFSTQSNGSCGARVCRVRGSSKTGTAGG